MILTKEHLRDLILDLPTDLICDYVNPGIYSVKRKNVEGNDIHFALFENGQDCNKDVPLTEDAMDVMAKAIKENQPISIDAALLNGGNKRSAIEGALIRTSEFYSVKVGRNKNIVWVPSDPHTVGTKGIWDESKVLPAAIIEGIDTTELEDHDPLKVGDTSPDGQVYIVDKDRLCYIVRNKSRGATGLRTISKALLNEYVEYLRQNPDASPNDARAALAGQTELDKFEYGYSSTLVCMAKMCLERPYVYVPQAVIHKSTPTERNLQQIYYGAPGTGKSYAINKQTEGMGDNVIRTTFHPDSDYSTFVGAYKPTKQVVKLRDSSGHVIKDYNEETGRTEEVTEDRIVYKFVAQAFVRAYTRAWRNFAEAPEGEQPQPVFLVIEEINRGNCAQIFGDLFQLLDRNDKGFSDYPIVADSDMRGYLFGAMSDARAKLTADRCADINALYKRDVMADVLSGNALMLPSNLCIWATMNTSDQSLFPIDSAFKRRWDWKYVPICKPANKNWKLQVGGTYYDWWSFLEKANDVIDSLTKSEDKKLGYFFCKADEETGIISEERFVGKVLFYLWNDVFKDYGLSGDQFKGTDGQPLVFANFYYVDVNGDTKENTPNVQKFLENLGVETAGEADDYNPAPANVEEGEDTNATDSERRETEIKRKEYWSAWLDYAQSHSEEYKMYFSGRKTPSFDHWYSYYIGRKGCHISVCQIRRRNEINLELSFDETNDDYLKLRTYQEEMEQELGFELVCQDKPAKKQCSIEEKHPMAPVNFENKDEWETQFAHILDRLLSMRRVFLKYLDMPKK